MVAFRKSRLHDEKGNLVPFGEIIRFPLIGIQAVFKKLFNYYPSAPIIPFSARYALDGILTPQMNVVEFGSGQSTLWYAKRCGKIISHETTDKWFQKVMKSIKAADCQNVQLIRWDGKSFCDEIKMPSPDLIIIDGINRVICVEYAIENASDNTWIYLDNSDKDSDPPDPDREMRSCERLMTEFSKSQKRKIEYFTGFSPAQAFAEQGMLIHPKTI